MDSGQSQVIKKKMEGKSGERDEYVKMQKSVNIKPFFMFGTQGGYKAGG